MFLPHCADSIGPPSRAKNVHPVICNTAIGKVRVYHLFGRSLTLSLFKRRTHRLRELKKKEVRAIFGPKSENWIMRDLISFTFHQTLLLLWQLN
jgi:hypothetical protein